MSRQCWFVDVVTTSRSQDRLCIWMDERGGPRSVFPTDPSSPDFSQGMGFLARLWRQGRPPLRVADSAFARTLEAALGSRHGLETGPFDPREAQGVEQARPFALGDWFIAHSRLVRPTMSFWWSLESLSMALTWLERAHGTLPRRVAVTGVGSPRLLTVRREDTGWMIVAGLAPESREALERWWDAPQPRLRVPFQAVHDRHRWTLEGIESVTDAESLLLGFDALADSAFVRVQTKSWSQGLRPRTLDLTHEAREVVFPHEEGLREWLARLSRKVSGRTRSR